MVCWGAGATAHADDTEPVSLAYQAPPGCPTEAEFFARLRSRVPRLRPAQRGEEARVFTVAVSVGPAGAAAHVRIVDRGGHEAARAIESASCEDVATAAILVIALALDPKARPPAPPIPSGLPREAPPAAAAGTFAVPSSPPPASATPASPQATLPAHRERGQSRPPARRPFRLGAGVDAVALAGVAPGVLGGIKSGVSIARAGDALFSPSLRLALVLAGPGEDQAGAGHAQLTHQGGRLDVCPLRATLGPPIAAIPCLTLEAGVLSASAAGTRQARRQSVPWTAGGAVVRLELGPIEALLVEVEAGLAAPFRRYAFYFSPDTFVYEVPRAGFRGALGLGVTFW
jgi:hypothetical protein